jgi:hypothetical protein
MPATSTLDVLVAGLRLIIGDLVLGRHPSRSARSPRGVNHALSRAPRSNGSATSM